MLSSTDFKPQHMIDLCTTLCELYVQTGKAEQALKYAQKGLKYREGNAEDKYEPFLYLGIANIMLCNNDSGVYYLQKAFPVLHISSIIHPPSALSLPPSFTHLTSYISPLPSSRNIRRKHFPFHYSFQCSSSPIFPIYA